jgi:hypothetical protein
MIVLAINEVMQCFEKRGCLRCDADNDRNDLASICDTNGLASMGFLRYWLK